MKKMLLTLFLSCLSFGFLSAYYEVTIIPVDSLHKINFVDINNRGELIGREDNTAPQPPTWDPGEGEHERAVIWDKENGKRFLDDLVDPRLNMIFISTIGINDKGDILARGIDLTKGYPTGQFWSPYCYDPIFCVLTPEDN